MQLNQGAKEDKHYVGVTGYPSLNESHAIHPKKNASTWERIYATRDVLDDHHWEVRNTAVAGFKGAVLGLAYASGFGIMHKSIPPLVLKKMLRYIRNNNFGHIRIIKDLLLPYTLTGFMMGSTYYFYQTALFGNPNNRFSADIISNAIFGQVATAVVISPNAHIYGMLGGIIFGAIKYFLYNSNFHQDQATLGTFTTFGNLTPEERKKQEYKDYIESLGHFHTVRAGQITEL